MANDTDACVPQVLTDFVFDLYDSVTLSQIAEDQGNFYNTVFRELSSKYFANSPWPSPQSIASECNGHPLFLALYRELTHRHWHAVSRPTLRDRIEGWDVYRELFDEILMDAEDYSNSSPPNFFILPEWSFDILHEFVYQFQGFCQFRTALHTTACHYGVSVDADGNVVTNTSSSPSGKSPPHHVVENVGILANAKDAWSAETVFYYLHRLVAIGMDAECKVPAYQYLGIFASVTLSRLECLLGDYTAALTALTPVDNNDILVKKDDDTKSPMQVLHSVFAARLSMAYHGGVSLFLLRRYRDAARLLGTICGVMQRGFKTGQLRKAASDQIHKVYDRMIALLAIVTHVCPPAGLVDDAVMKTVREKHGSQLSKVDAGEEGYEDLFLYACPKFVSAAVPDFTNTSTSTTPYTGPPHSSHSTTNNEVYKLQIKQFMKEMESQQSYRKLRSYMKLYTSIALSKLASFHDCSNPQEFLPMLLAYKHKMNQLEATTNSNEKDTKESSDADAMALEGTAKSAMDIHYYLVNDMVHVDEAEKQRRFENYFMAQISQNIDIMKDVDAINTTT